MKTWAESRAAWTLDVAGRQALGFAVKFEIDHLIAHVRR